MSNKAPDKKSVKFTKITLAKSGGVALQLEETKIENGGTYIEKETRESDKIAHPDLKNAMQDLKIALIKTWNLPGEEDEVQEWAENNLEVSSISINPSGEAIVVTGKVKAETGQKMSMNSPRIDLTQDAYGFEDQVQDTVLTIKAEAYAFLYENKRAQLELFDGNQEDPSDGED